MKLLIREYLSMLKESGELDLLLPDLLLSMNIQPLSKPKRGVRQYGVDLKAIGVDIEDNKKKIFLFVIKQKDIDRLAWNDGPQSVRQSIDEIIDVYIGSMIEPYYKQLPTKIIVCCNGVIDQAIGHNWSSYTDKASKPGICEFDFWGADKLSTLIEQHLLDEYLFPESVQKHIRKTLAFLDLKDYDLTHFYMLIDEVLFQRNESKSKKQIQVLRLLNLCQNLVFHWSNEANNLKPAFLAAERLILRLWDWIIQNGLLENKYIIDEFLNINNSRLKINKAYFNKIQNHCYVYDGLSYLSSAKLEYPLITFEQIGILGSIGASLIDYQIQGEEGLRFYKSKDIEVVADAIVNLIQNNKACLYPLYDSHIIDINLGLLTLFYANRKKDAIIWLNSLLKYIFYSYKLNNKFPILSDSYDDLIDIEFGYVEAKFESSTLLPALLEWCIVFDQQQSYNDSINAINDLFSDVNLQIWYPDQLTEKYLYKGDALLESGVMRHSIKLPQEFQSFKINTLEESKIEDKPDEFKFYKYGFKSICLTSSRHFLTPVMPYIWRKLITNNYYE